MEKLMSFQKVIDELRDIYGHRELWLHSGLSEDLLPETSQRRKEWRWPKILKRNGRAIAERTGEGDRWALIGDYRKVQSEHSAPPWNACLIDDKFRSRVLFLG